MSAISALVSPANGFPGAPAEDEAEPSRSAFNISPKLLAAPRCDSALTDRSRSCNAGERL